MKNVEALMLPSEALHSCALPMPIVTAVTKINAITACLTYTPAAILYPWLAFQGAGRADATGTFEQAHRRRAERCAPRFCCVARVGYDASGKRLT